MGLLFAAAKTIPLLRRESVVVLFHSDNQQQRRMFNSVYSPFFGKQMVYVFSIQKPYYYFVLFLDKNRDS